MGGPTDFGNVSQLVPALHANMAVQSWPAVNHQHEFAAHCVTPAGDRTMLDDAKAMALTALAYATDPGIVNDHGGNPDTDEPDVTPQGCGMRAAGSQSP
jgi:hypothetical protein